jgi:hypothetical protein
MKTKMQFENIRIFAVETSFSSFPSYVICTAERVNDREYRGESFLLHKKPIDLYDQIILCGKKYL